MESLAILMLLFNSMSIDIERNYNEKTGDRHFHFKTEPVQKGQVIQKFFEQRRIRNQKNYELRMFKFENRKSGRKNEYFYNFKANEAKTR